MLVGLIRECLYRLACRLVDSFPLNVFVVVDVDSLEREHIVVVVADRLEREHRDESPER